MDLYDAHTGFTVAQSQKMNLNLYIKRRKRSDDPSPLLEMKDQQFSLSLIGDHTVKIGEFNISIVAQF